MSKRLFAVASLLIVASLLQRSGDLGKAAEMIGRALHLLPHNAEARQAQAIVARVLTENPRPMLPQRHTIPPQVEAAVLTALEKLPADRFPSAAAFAEALEGLANPKSATFTMRAAPPPVAALRRCPRSARLGHPDDRDGQLGAGCRHGALP